jgi:phosphoglycolate phosphatase
MQHCQTLLFDLDGTLSDSSAGITSSIAYALEKSGVTPPPMADLRACIGPPLRQSLARFVPAAVVETTYAHYRERYDDQGGMFENTLYPDIVPLLQDLRAAGKRLYVATAKPQDVAAKIIAHFGLLPYFSAVYGCLPDGRLADKAELIALLCAQEAVAPTAAVMIGDRAHDIIGAVANGLHSIGVLWGFGTAAELQAAGAHAIADTPAALRAQLL